MAFAQRVSLKTHITSKHSTGMDNEFHQVENNTDIRAEVVTQMNHI